MASNPFGIPMSEPKPGSQPSRDADAPRIVREAEQSGRTSQNEARPNPQQTPEQFEQAGREFQRRSRNNG